jgi:hypothetical protein
MKATSAFAVLALLFAASRACAQDHNVMSPTGVPQVEQSPQAGNVITPYRFNPAPKHLSPSEEQEALGYKAQLQGQERGLEQLQSQHSSDPFQRQKLINTQRELNRMNSVLHP